MKLGLKNLKLILTIGFHLYKEKIGSFIKEHNREPKIDSADPQERRMAEANSEITHWAEYDYIIINKNLEVCFKQIENIINMNKQKISISSLSTQ